MNIYDTKPIFCIVCGEEMGEVDIGAEIIRPKCGSCANPIPQNDDKASYIINSMRHRY